jgi:hypothetical protein
MDQQTRGAHSKNRATTRTLAVWGRADAGRAGQLHPGTDLVLEVSLADAVALPDGVALDDHLGSDARVCVDREAHDRYRLWRERHARQLTVEGIDLAHIWEVELIAQCFLPAACLRRGMPLALDAGEHERVSTRLIEPGPRRLVGAVAGEMGVDVVERGDGIAQRAQLRRSPSPLGLAVARSGVRPYVRGEVLNIAYWNTLPLLSQLAWRRGGPRIVSSPLPVRNIGGARAIALAARGGWSGLPGPRARARSRAIIAARLGAMDGDQTNADPFDAAVHSYAVETLQRLALETLAHVEHARRALAGRRVRVGLLPFDGPEQARMLMPALRETGARTLLAQHGFCGRLGDPEMLIADHLAVWSEHDRTYRQDRDPATVTVTGNPGVTHLAALAPPRRERCGCSVVIVDYGGRMSVGLDRRIHRRHVAVALQALAHARPGSRVIVRPHPSDLVPDGYERLAARHPQLRVQVDAGSPIEVLLAGVDLCVGAVSTATLQACALGVPTVALNVSATVRPWPFDGGALPSGTDADSLATAIARTLRQSEVAGRAEALEALGVRGDAIERLIDLIAQLSR